MIKAIQALAISLLAVFAPAQGMILTSLGLIAIDLLTGVWAALKRKEPITSSGLKRTIIKVCVYEVAILLGFVTETYLMHGILPVSSIISAFVGVTELKSVLENVNVIGGGNLLKDLLKQLSGPK